MKITKNYPGLTRAENGDYILNGDLISEEGIEIDLDDRLVVTGRIKAGLGIKAGAYIDCGKRIFAGTSVYDCENSCEKTIKCAELRNGTVAYGDLVITKKEETNED